MIEWCNSRDHAVQRGSHRENAPMMRIRADITRIDLALALCQGMSGEGKDVTGSAGFVQRIFQAEAGLRRDEPGEALPVSADGSGRAEENVCPLAAREARSCAPCRLERPADVMRLGLRYRPDEPTCERIPDFDALVRISRRACDEHRRMSLADTVHAFFPNGFFRNDEKIRCFD